MSKYHVRQPSRRDKLIMCLADQRRRILLECLAEESTPIVLEELVKEVREQDSGPPDQTTIALFHNHLPQMEDAGILNIDHEMKTVEEGGLFEISMQMLAMVENHVGMESE